MENTDVTYYCFNKYCSVSIYNTDTAITLLLPYDEATFAAPQRCTLCNCQLISWIDLEVKSLLLGQRIPLAPYRQAS